MIFFFLLLLLIYMLLSEEKAKNYKEIEELKMSIDDLKNKLFLKKFPSSAKNLKNYSRLNSPSIQRFENLNEHLKGNKSEKEIEKDITPFPKFINTGKSQLKTSSDFSIEKLKNISLNILNEIKENEDDKSKIKKLEKLIEYDNTNESIIKEYLKF